MITCEKLHDIIDTYKHGVARFTYENGNLVVSVKGKKLTPDYLAKGWENILPKNGVYIMYEKNETAHGGERIVRIGINSRQDDRLLKRIYSHYYGTMRRSVFRKHIGSCLLNKGIPAESLEKEITAYIETNISFVLIGVNDEERRNKLETMLISTVANCEECNSSENWLGKYAKNPTISQGKLWNVIGLNGHNLPEEAQQWLLDGLVMGCDLSHFTAD